jgi:hypothetical protein
MEEEQDCYAANRKYLSNMMLPSNAEGRKYTKSNCFGIMIFDLSRGSLCVQCTLLCILGNV